MPDRIRAAVAIQRPIVSGVDLQDDVHNAIARFANAQLYKDPARIDRMRREVVRLMARKWFPEARKVGAASARPILEALGGDLTKKGSVLRGHVLRDWRKFSRNNMGAFRAALKGGARELSGQVEAAFLRAARDNQSQQQLVGNLVRADRAELARLKVVRGEIQEAGEKLAGAETRLANASKRKQVRAKREVRKAKTELRKAKAKVGQAKTFLARFETYTQGDARDAIRRHAQQAQFEAFKQAGFREMAWIAVNGTDACPDCDGRHGEVRRYEQWAGDGPGSGGTICGGACMCQLVPQEYAKGRPGLDKPVNPYQRPDLPSTATP